MFNADFLQLTEESLVIGILIMVRISGLFVSGLFFGHASIPMMARAMLILLLTLILSPLFIDSAPVIRFDVLYMSFLVLKELLVGAILGFASNVVY